MISYQSLVEKVRDRARLESGDRARSVIQAVVSTLAHSLPPGERRRLADALPALVEPAADVTSTSEPRTGFAAVSQIGAQLDEPPERARYLTQAVVEELQAQDSQLVESLRAHLPSETVDVLEEAGQPPEVAETVVPDRPTRLTADEVHAALKKRLPDWTGDETGISRTVGLPDDRMIPLVARVEQVARAMNDHAHIQRRPGSITFVLRTGPASVTEPDLALAERIDEAIMDIGSGGRPGRAGVG